MKNIRLIGILAAVAALLMIPFVAMKIGVEGVAWKVGDFIVAGILLLGAGLACEFFLRMFKTTVRRLAACSVVLTILAVVWIELAVGILGTPLAGN